MNQKKKNKQKPHWTLKKISTHKINQKSNKKLMKHKLKEINQANLKLK